MYAKSSIFGLAVHAHHRVTPADSRVRALVVATFLLAAGLLGGSPFVCGVAAAETGTLKLMVTGCAGTPHENALVEVEILRGGGSVIATDSDYTDDGYVEFTFTILQNGDRARVTVPDCGGSEVAHIYEWVSEDGGDKPGFWDIGTTIPNSLCADGWWDQGENIIQCKCD